MTEARAAAERGVRVRDALAFFAFDRLVLIALVIASFAYPIAPRIPMTEGVMHVSEPFLRNPELLRPFAHWDGVNYVQIAAEGYDLDGRTAFFPLYPLLLRLLSFGQTEWMVAAGALLSFVAGAIASVLLVKLVSLDRPRAAWPALVLMLVFPTSLFLTAVYAEAVVLALWLGAAYAARRRRWWIAGALGALAAAARPTGIGIVVLLAIEYAVLERTWRRRDVLSLALPFAGIGAYALYLWATFGDPLEFMRAQEQWERGVGVPVFRQLEGVPLIRIITSTNIWAWLIAIALSLWCMRVFRPSYGAFAALVLLAGPLSGSFQSSTRHVGIMWPVFVTVALYIGEGRRLTAVAITLAMGLALYAILFSHAYKVF